MESKILKLYEFNLLLIFSNKIIGFNFKYILCVQIIITLNREEKKELG